ncbi:Efflux pump atB [Cladobotryum mycophilum]|uniref:Efflux pump atB n=1 Tax=Cladobotryum mycophilum TaxID=491253 RepID=A0ABR0S9M5_9HYPO
MSSDEKRRELDGSSSEPDTNANSPKMALGEEKQQQQQQQQDPSKEYLVEWDGDNDPLDPRTFSATRKWLYLIIVSMGSLLVTATSSLYSSCYEQLIEKFGCSQEIVTLGLSLYVLGLGIGPLIFSPLSEFYGRRPIYIVSTVFFLIWLIPCAAAQNIETLLVARFLNGLSGGAFLGVAGGTVVDMFVPQQLLLPMTIFTGAPFVGPALGPLIGGFINSFTNWRWSFYVLIIWGAVILVCVLFVPETFHPILLAKKAEACRQSTNNSQYHSASEIARASKTLTQALMASLFVPFQLLFLDPMILALSAYTSLIQGILYLFFGAFPLVFGRNHGFNLWQVGLTFLGLLIGNFVACMFNPYWHKNWMGLIQKMKAKHGADYKPEPELRLPPALIGSVMVTVTLFWFAWTSFSSVHWIVPIIATVFFSTGFFFVFQGLWTFLMAAYPKYAASAMAVNTTTRCIFAAAFPLFTDQMYNNLGFEWASSLLAFLTLVILPFPYIFYRYGKSLRMRSKFASG